MTTRSLCYLAAVTMAVISCSVGCEQPSPTDRDAATKELINEVLGTSVTFSNAPASTPKPDSEVDAIKVESSIVKSESSSAESINNQPDANGAAKESTPVRESTATKESSGSRAEPKYLPKNAVDDPTKPWGTSITFPRETWEVQYLGNNPVGYFHHRIEIITGGSMKHKAEWKLRVSVKGESQERYILLNTTEGANGELLSLDGKLEIGEKRQSFSAKVNNDALTIVGVDDEKPFSVTIPWERKFRGPFAVEQSMFRNPLQPREVRRLKYFDPILRKLVDGRLEASDYILTPTMLGGVKELLEVRNIGIVGENGGYALLWVDERGEGFKSYVPENDLLSFRTQPIEAEVVASTAELRRQELLAVPLNGSVNRLQNHSLKSIAFEVEHKKFENPHQFLKDGSAQRIRSVFGGTVNVTVFLGGRGTDSYQNTDDASDGKGYTTPSSFIPSNSDRIIQRANAMVLADKSIKMETATNFQKANACRREIQKRIGVREFDRRIGLFTNILKTKQANCIEHACFLAAHCRALDIPTRIVFGLKFNQKPESPSMVFHTWVEIQDGKRWIPMDSTDVPSNAEAADEGKASIDRIKFKETSFNNPNPYLEILEVCRLLPGLQVKVLPQEVP